MKTVTLANAEDFRKQLMLVRSLSDTLRDLLAGRATRTDVKKWTRALWPPSNGLGNPFMSREAACIFDSIYNIDERWGDSPLVRDVDLRAYLRWLTEGQVFLADDEPVVIVARNIEQFASAVNGNAIRWWLDGIGWCAEVRFCAAATGRPFVAHSHLENPNSMSISKLARDDWHDALVELFEALAIDDKDCTFINPGVDLSRVPCWALWHQDDNNNCFEVNRSKSYAKACAQANLFAARGHKQLYWIDLV